MADTLLILHVKGTEAETAQLPRNIVRTAISEGQLTQSQLIWSAAENAWKPASEWPDLFPGERFILHVKGTETETKELPKQAIRSAISQGQITHSQLIWSPSDGAWRQVRELPELLPTQKLAPAPSPSRVPMAPMPKSAGTIIPESPTGPVARAAEARPRRAREASVVAGPPRVRVAGPPRVQIAAQRPHVATAPVAAPHVRVAETPAARVVAPAPVVAHPTGDLVVKRDANSRWLKRICIGLGIFIALIFGGNYFVVDRPLVSSLGSTSYFNVGVYAHLGAFMQPNVIVIHIPASSTITSDNLTDFLVSLARSTPQNPITGSLFDRVAITSGWTVQYSFSGGAWKSLGEESEGQRKEFLLDQMDDASGQPLLSKSASNDATRQAEREKIWDAFVAHFTATR